jgi:F-type H+-transporting ATPase subunit epsilon
VAIQVEIVTPEQLAWSGQASEVRLPGWNGQFGVFEQHEHFLTLLRGGVAVVIQEGGSPISFIIGRGFAEATPSKVTVLTDSLTAAQDIDRAQAFANYSELEAKLGKISSYDAEWELAEEQLEIALAVMSL